MSTIFQLRRGSATEASNLLGFEGELFIDLDNQQLRYHDGSQIGGHVIGRNANTIAEYNITDAYTKTQTNDLLDQKANLGTVALLVEAMKEQDERIKKLESIIETLKA